MQYLVVIERGPTNFGAHVPDLPGCVAVAESQAEAGAAVPALGCTRDRTRPGSAAALGALGARLALSLMAPPVRDLAEAVQRLSACEPAIRALGVQRLALFGSVLRDEPRPDSDADLLVQFTPGTKTYTRFLGLSELLERELGRRVELVTTEALSPFIGPRILSEAADVLRAA